MFTVIEAEQRSAEWFRARAGRLTGSKAWLVTDFLKTGARGESAKRRDYRLQLVCERLTGLPQEDGDGFVTDAMQRGITLEPAAFAAYEALTGEVAHKSGFLSHNTLRVGCSLDGHIDGFKGVLEIKCPKTATHLTYWRGKSEAPAEHLAQITHNLWVTGAEWCDFLSFDDRLPDGLQTFLARVKREDVDIAAYESAALKFLAEVDAEVAEIQSRRAA
jgi:predicted phage-related endonuclease